MDFAKLRKRIALYTGIPIVVVSLVSLSYFRLFDNYELETLDIRFRWRPTIPVDENIVIIEISDDTIDALGQWPMPREYHANLVEILTEAGVRSIVFDVFFSEASDVESDMKFREAIRKSKKVYLPYVFDIPRRGTGRIPSAVKWQEPLLDGFSEFAKGTGYINIIPDTDGKRRRVPPIIRYGGIFYPHLSFLVGLDYLGLTMDQVDIEPGKRLIIENRLSIPLDSDSNIIVNFPGKWVDTFRHYSYIDVIRSYLNMKVPEAMSGEALVDLASLKGSVCFIGVTGTATPDAHPSPFDAVYPGVGVHASLFNSVVHERFVERASRLTNILILLFLSLIASLIARRAKTLMGFFYVFAFMLVYVLLSTALFIVWGLWIDVFYPVIVVFILYLGVTFAKYIDETYKREILEKELGIAKKIQESFLPKENPQFAGVEVAAKMATARQVGGDLYDFVELGKKERLGIMIGDVSGKGVPAALYMAKVVSEFKNYSGENLASETITKLNERLCRESGSGLFVTLSYLIFNAGKASISYSSGGHLPLIIVKKDTPDPELIDLEEGTPLGLFEGFFSEKEIKFAKGDTFILYTDGVTEAMSPKGDMFGQDRLVDIVKNNKSLNSQALVELIQNRVKAFEGKKQHDDITVIVVRAV